MSRLVLPLLLAFVAAPLLAGKRAAPELPAVAPAPPAPGVYLRSGFDTDPSMYVGRFLPDGPVDESSGMQLACSQLVSWRKIDAGAVQYDEVFQASTSAAARIGVPLVAGASGSTTSGTTVRVRYTLTNKLVYEISDPRAYETCCKAAADQCTGRFIGEFYEGTGDVFYSAGQQRSARGGGVTTTVAGNIEVKDGVSWAKSITFTRPVYFAFKTTPNPYSGAAQESCGSWVDAPPRSTQGTYFVGVSPWHPAEAPARQAALADARAQVVRWVGTEITSGTASATVSSGDLARVRDALTQESRVTEVSAGVARLVKDESWCVTPVASPEGTVYEAKVLAFLPAESEADAARALLDAR